MARQRGNDKYSTEIVANEMEMLGGKSDDGAKAAQPDKYPSHQPQPANNQPVDDGSFDFDTVLMSRYDKDNGEGLNK